jgi:hypothetical protein
VNTLFCLSDGGVPTDIPEVLRPYVPQRVVNDYTVPGVNFWFLSRCPSTGFARYAFEATREPTRFVTPHNHLGTLDFRVLQGQLKHTEYVPDADQYNDRSDLWLLSRIRNSPKEVHRLPIKPSRLRYTSLVMHHAEGSGFTVPWWQIHSIEYAKSCIVMFEAHPEQQDSVAILEPLGADGRHITTHTIKPWMFGARVRPLTVDL